MILAIQKELIERRDYLEDAIIETIYFGGGTPSLLTKEELQSILATIESHFYVAKDVECTLEANPDDCSVDKLSSWKQLGVNRLSIGIQSFKSSDLDWMNRSHTEEEARICVRLAKEIGFDNLTVDLMYGLPELSMTEWKSHIETVLSWGVPHISSYCLTVENNTVLDKRVKSGELKVANDAEQSSQFEILVDLLEQSGIHQYEISNFAKKGFESRHNSNYWKGVPYLGIGPSAHSFNKRSRTWNLANNALYMKALENGLPFSETEELSHKDQFNELLLTGLRTVYGVSLDALETLIPLTPSFRAMVETFEKNGWMIKERGQLFLTKQGRLRADHIASELFLV